MFDTTTQPVDTDQVLAQVAALLDSISLETYASLKPASQLSACNQLGRLEARVKAHQLAAARAADESQAAKAVGATSTGAALANGFGGDPRAAARLLNQARKLDEATATHDALAKGEISLGQAELIADRIKNLPGDPTDAQREGCQTQLLDQAQKMSLKDLSRRADRITDTYAKPEQVDAHEDQILRDRETEARKKSYFWLADRRDGTYKGEFVIPEAQGEMLKNCLEALNAPQIRQNREDDPAAAVLDDRPTYGQQLAEAFCTLIEHLPADRLPQTAGVGVTVTVNIELKSLIDGIKAGTLSTGCRISATEARRMAMGVPPQKSA